jgi:hypothetical protein
VLAPLHSGPSDDRIANYRTAREIARCWNLHSTMRIYLEILYMQHHRQIQITSSSDARGAWTPREMRMAQSIDVRDHGALSEDEETDVKRGAKSGSDQFRANGSISH